MISVSFWNTEHCDARLCRYGICEDENPTPPTLDQLRFSSAMTTTVLMEFPVGRCPHSDPVGSGELDGDGDRDGVGEDVGVGLLDGVGEGGGVGDVDGNGDGDGDGGGTIDPKTLCRASK